MSKGSLLINNDCLKEVKEPECSDAKMVSGFKELVGISKMDALKDEPFGVDYKNVYTSTLDEREKSAGGNIELKELKELLLIHLDFIQQQSEQLTTKERHITDLRNENEMLKMRIERMERRVAIQKSRPSSSASSPGGPLENGGEGTTGKGKKRRLRDVELDEPGSSGKQKFNRSMRRYLSPAGPGRDGERSSEATQQTMTEESYWTLVGERDARWTTDPPNQPQPKPSALEVPKWRTKTFSAIYTMEGTENLSDDVFVRRHFRLEADERRRKKWDVQRMREQRQVERLSRGVRGGGGGAAGGGGEEEGEETLQMPPDPLLLTLSVQTMVPVTAFGFPMPAVVDNVDFTLPWLSGKDPRGASWSSRPLSRRGKR